MDERLLSKWPQEVAAYYRELASRRAWPESAANAFMETVEYYRRLSENPGERSYWQGADPDGDAQWFVEAVSDETGTLIPTRQLVVQDDGSRAHYSWRCLEDEAGRLAEGSMDDWVDLLEPIPPDAFEAQWVAQ